jgi:Zn-dependent protease
MMVSLIIVSVVIHELAHGLVAISQGDNTPKELGHMTINPVKHMGWAGIIALCLFGISWGSMPVNPQNFRFKRFSSVLVSLAGPLANLLLAVALLSTFVFVLPNLNLSESSIKIAAAFFQMGAVFNMVLCLFNLLPIPPLDGFQAIGEFVPALKKFANNSNLPFLFLILLFNIPGFWSSIYELASKVLGFLLGLMLQIRS